VDYARLKDKLHAIEGVTDVHDLHVWMLSVDRPLVTVHLKAADPDKAMRDAHAIFHRSVTSRSSTVIIIIIIIIIIVWMLSVDRPLVTVHLNQVSQAPT
jgi:Co/Zn/Cd efflux system component